MLIISDTTPIISLMKAGQFFDEKFLSKKDVEHCLVLLKECNIRISDSLCNKVYEHIEK